MKEQEYHSLRAVEDSHWWFQSLHTLLVRQVRKYNQVTHPRILEAGCGTGGLAEKLSIFAEVVCIDQSPIAVEYSKKRGLNVSQADLNTFSPQQNYYDVITCVDVLYHLNITSAEDIVKKFAVGLQPGGILCIHLPALEWLRSFHDVNTEAKHRYTLKEAKELVQNADFEIIWASYHMMLLLPVVALHRFLSSQSKEGAHSSDVRKTPWLINFVLQIICKTENAISSIVPLPIGSSLYITARKTVR